ncbi:MAG: aspartate carbamoyltransferase [Pseudomonadota bacterium]
MVEINRSDIFHVIDPRQFERASLDRLCELATKIRTLAKSVEGSRRLQTLLAHRRAMLYFTQPSTRTFLSFNNACHVLGIRTSEIRDRSTSSEVKGESFADSIRTFSSYVDVIIMRSPHAGRAKEAAELMDRIPRPVPVINAGSGSDQHPTQALLDIYTLQRSFADRSGIEGKTIAMMGDLKRGRTVRSLCRLLKHYPGVSIVFIAPPAFAMESDVKGFLDKEGIGYRETDTLRPELPNIDALYVTRIQAEWDTQGESDVIDLSEYCVNPETIGLMHDEAIVMHPLPRGPEIDPTVDQDKRAMYWRQERNGMWMRAALLMEIFGVSDALS